MIGSNGFRLARLLAPALLLLAAQAQADVYIGAGAY